MAFPSRAVMTLALVALAGCASREKVEAPDPSIVGEWRSPSTGASVTFSSGGLYSLTPKGAARPVMGSFSFDPKESTLTLQTRRESSMCADDIGTYRVRIGGLTLDPEPVRDTCEARRGILSKPLERVGRAPGAAR